VNDMVESSVKIVVKLNDGSMLESAERVVDVDVNEVAAAQAENLQLRGVVLLDRYGEEGVAYVIPRENLMYLKVMDVSEDE